MKTSLRSITYKGYRFVGNYTRDQMDLSIAQDMERHAAALRGPEHFRFVVARQYHRRPIVN